MDCFTAFARMRVTHIVSDSCNDATQALGNSTFLLVCYDLKFIISLAKALERRKVAKSYYPCIL